MLEEAFEEHAELLAKVREHLMDDLRDAAELAGQGDRLCLLNTKTGFNVCGSAVDQAPANGSQGIGRLVG